MVSTKKKMRTGFEDLQGGKHRWQHSVGVSMLPVLALAVVTGWSGYLGVTISILVVAVLVLVLCLVHAGVTVRDMVSAGLILLAVGALVFTSLSQAKANDLGAPNEGLGVNSAPIDENYETVLEDENVLRAEEGRPLVEEEEENQNEVTYLAETSKGQVTVKYGEVYEKTTELHTDKVDNGWEVSQSMMGGTTAALLLEGEKGSDVTCTILVDGKVADSATGKGKADCLYDLPDFGKTSK